MTMRDESHPDSEPLVLEASVVGDVFDLVLSRAGYEAMEDALEMLRETNPNATYNDVLKWMLGSLIEDLEAEMN